MVSTLLAAAPATAASFAAAVGAALASDPRHDEAAVAIVSRLLEQRTAAGHACVDVNQRLALSERSSSGWTALHAVCQDAAGEHATLARVLLAHGAAVDAVAAGGPPLLWALLAGHMTIAAALLEAGASVGNWSSTDASGASVAEAAGFVHHAVVHTSQGGPAVPSLLELATSPSSFRLQEHKSLQLRLMSITHSLWYAQHKPIDEQDA